MSRRTLFSIVSATASRLSRIPAGREATASSTPRSVMSCTRVRSSNAEIGSLSSARIYASSKCRMAGSYTFMSKNIKRKNTKSNNYTILPMRW